MIDNKTIVDTIHGHSFKCVQPVNIYGSVIGDNVFVGPFVEIQRNTLIGSNVRIQSHSFVCEYVTIGDNSFVGHGVMFINDKFSDGGPARGDKSKWKSTFIGKNVSIGSNASILPVTICDNVVIGAGSVVCTDISISGVYAGNPCKLLRPYVTASEENDPSGS